MRLATVADLRAEIEILHDVPTIEAAIAADRAAALIIVEKELADTIAKVKAGLTKLGFGRFLALKPQVSCPGLGTWAPVARDYVTEFLYSNIEIEALEAKRQSILFSCPCPNGDRFIYSSGPRFDLEARREAILSNRIPEADGNAVAIAATEQKLRELITLPRSSPIESRLTSRHKQHATCYRGRGVNCSESGKNVPAPTPTPTRGTVEWLTGGARISILD